MTSLSLMPREDMERICLKLLVFALQVPPLHIANHQVGRERTVLLPVLVGFAHRFQALLQEHGLEVAKEIGVSPRDLQWFCDSLEASLGDRDARLFQSRSIAGSGHPLV